MSSRGIGRGAGGLMLAVLVLSASAVQAAQPAVRAAFTGHQQEDAWASMAYCSDCESGYATGPYCEPEYCGNGSCCDSGYGEPQCDAPCSLDGCCDPCVGPWAHRSGIWGQFLYLHPTGADMHHAQQQNGTGGAGTVPFGLIGVADPDHTPGFRMGGQIACDLCSSIAVNYTYLDSSAIDYLVPPANVGGGLGTIGSLVHHPGTAVTSSAGPVSAQYDIRMQMADGEYRRLLRVSECGWINYSVGGRYGRLDQKFSQNGTFGGSQGGVIDTSTEIDFDGGGLKVGLDGERILGRGRFSSYGNVSASALAGSFRGDYRQYNSTTDSDLAIVRWEDDRITPMFEYEVGLAWTSCSGCVRAKVGYTAIYWFNAVTTPEFVDAVQADNYVDVGDTLSFSGLTSSVEWRF